MKKRILPFFTLFLSFIICFSIFSSLSYADNSSVIPKTVTTTSSGKTTMRIEGLVSAKSVGTIPKGTKVSVTSYARVKYIWWCKVKYKNTTGWIQAKDIQNFYFANKTNLSYSVANSKVNVFSNPSVNSTYVASLSQGKGVTFSEFKPVNGSLWGRIQKCSSNSKCVGKWVCVKEGTSEYSVSYSGAVKVKNTNKNKSTAPIYTGPGSNYTVKANPKNTTELVIYRIDLNSSNNKNWFGKISTKAYANKYIYMGNIIYYK